MDEEVQWMIDNWLLPTIITDDQYIYHCCRERGTLVNSKVIMGWDFYPRLLGSYAMQVHKIYNL